MAATLSGAGNLVGPAGGGAIVYTSDFETFTAGPRGFSFALTCVTPSLGATPGSSLDSLSGVSNGSFRASVPEPAN